VAEEQRPVVARDPRVRGALESFLFFDQVFMGVNERRLKDAF